MEKSQVLAERKLWIENTEDGLRKEVILRIGYPYWVVENEEAACSVEIYGFFEALQNQEIKDIQGIDLLQAIELSLFFLNNFLMNIPDKYKVYWLDGEPYEYDPHSAG
jgi:hypothetical protein